MSYKQKKVEVDRHSPSGIVTSVTLTFRFKQEGPYWVGVCSELGTSAYGHTLSEAERELGEAIELQLNEIERLGFLEEYLRHHNVFEKSGSLSEGLAWALRSNRNR